MSDSEPKISQRAERTGIGALLSSLRGDNLAEKMAEMKAESSQSDTELAPAVETAPKPLNRREKRKLMQQNQKEQFPLQGETQNSEKSAKLAPTPSIPTLLTLKSCDENAFKNYEAKFGNIATKNNNFVQIALQNNGSTRAISASQDRFVRVFAIENEGLLSLKWQYNMGGLIMDMKWRSGGDAFFVSAKGRPIQMFDMETEGIVKSFRGKDSGDNVVEAYSIGETDGKLIGGYRNQFQIWDIETSAASAIKLFDKQYSTGITGLPLSIDIHPSMPDLFAAVGSSSRAGIYSLKWSSNISTFEGSLRGYTHVKFSPDGTKLFASERSGDVHCFDTRMNMLTQILKRPMENALRTRFDIDPSGRLLYTGSSSGELLVYDLHDFNEEIQPVFVSKVASACVPCVSVKNQRIVLCSGERIYPDCELLGEPMELDRENSELPRNSIQLFDIE